MADLGLRTSDIVNGTRVNLEALRDGLLMGVMPGWQGFHAYSGTLGTWFDMPTSVSWVCVANTALIIKGTITWYPYGSTDSGFGDGSPNTILYEFSGNTGVTYETIGTVTFYYKSGGACWKIDWS